VLVHSGKDKATGETVHQYLYYLGYVKNTPIAYKTAINYNGQTPIVSAGVIDTIFVKRGLLYRIFGSPQQTPQFQAMQKEALIPRLATIYRVSKKQYKLILLQYTLHIAPSPEFGSGRP
jgi:hypothetical protein